MRKENQEATNKTNSDHTTNRNTRWTKLIEIHTNI